MQKLLYVVIFDLFYLAGQAQQLQSVREFADDQYLKGNYRSALKEYQRLLYFDEHHEYVDTYAKIALLFYLTEDYENAIKYYDFAYRAKTGDSLKYDYILKKALCNLRKGSYYAALNELYDLPKRKSGCLVHQKKIYLATCFFGLDQFDKSFDYISADADSFQVVEIKRLYEQLEKTRRKFNPKKIKLMSMVLPGLGQAYTGNFVKHHQFGGSSFLNWMVCYFDRADVWIL